MSDASLSPSAFVAKIVSTFSIPRVAGATPLIETDVMWRKLTEEERKQAELTTPGQTSIFKLDSGVVLVDMHANRQQIWFQNIDARNAVPALEQALLQAAPNIGKLDDQPLDQPGGLRSRTFAADLGGGRLVRIEAIYTASIAVPSDMDYFKVVIDALQDTGDAAKAPN